MVKWRLHAVYLPQWALLLIIVILPLHIILHALYLLIWALLILKIKILQGCTVVRDVYLLKWAIKSQLINLKALHCVPQKFLQLFWRLSSLLKPLISWELYSEQLSWHTRVSISERSSRCETLWEESLMHACAAPRLHNMKNQTWTCMIIIAYLYHAGSDFKTLALSYRMQTVASSTFINVTKFLERAEMLMQMSVESLNELIVNLLSVDGSILSSAFYSNSSRLIACVIVVHVGPLMCIN